jgi:hypothetical protein
MRRISARVVPIEYVYGNSATDYCALFGNEKNFRRVVPIEYEYGNSATDYCALFGNEKNFRRVVPIDQKQRRLHISSDFCTTHRCLTGSLLVMKRGFFNTTRKQNARAFSGKQNSLQPKYYACVARSSKPCLCVSSIKRGEFTINSLHKDKQ